MSSSNQEDQATKNKDAFLVGGKQAILTDKTTKSEFLLSSPVCKIGRDENNDISLSDDAYVSRHHAWVLLIKEAWWVEDLGSTNGTILNGDPLQVRKQIAAGDCIKLGRTELVFELR
jgi:pSer/pThr/pTyr-binding forkhead associated (FHA) protein